MATIPTTSTTLLKDVANDSQHVRWNEFVTRYRPMMEAYMRERFPTVEADDIIQETFIALCKVLPSYRYAPDEKGHFRNYLTGILRNKAFRQLHKDRQRLQLADKSQEPGTASAAHIDANEESYRAAIFEIALRLFLADESIADRTKRIFQRIAINGESPADVAAAFKMTRHAVDQSKCRAMARLRELVKELESLSDA